MISNSDFEKLWFLYKTEGASKGISINAFCLSRGVNYNEFNKWFRKMHKSVVPVEIEGAPEGEIEETVETVSDATNKDRRPKSGGIHVFIRTHDGSKTCSDKYSGQKNDGINDGRDDFDGTQKSLPANTPGPVGSDCDKSSSNGKSDSLLAEIKKLYKREKYYANHPEIFKTPAMIKDARNDEYTNGIVEGMHKKLLDLIAKGEDYFPDKVWRALNYFHNFWDQIFAYRHDGEYSIDNMAVERAIRPLTVQRKTDYSFAVRKGRRTRGYTIHLYRPVYRSVATSVTSSWTMSGHGTGAVGTLVT